MALSIQTEEGRSFTKTRRLSGRIDSESVGELDLQLDRVLDTAIKVLVFDLAGLEYTTSAGLRSFLRAQKNMNQRAGKVLFVNVQAPVQRVFDIVKAVNLATVFRSVQELDEYLDAMQTKGPEGAE